MSVAAFDNFNLLFQLLQTTRNLARDINSNARTHLAWLSLQLDGSQGNPTLQQIAQAINDCAASYINIINQGRAFVTANNAAATAAVGLISATLADLNNYVSPLQTAATNLQSADKSTVINAQAACNAAIAAVPSPPTVFSGV